MISRGLPQAHASRLERFKKQVMALGDDCEKETARRSFECREAEFERSKRIRLSVEDFRPIRLIGRGAFGIVLPIGYALRATAW